MKIETQALEDHQSLIRVELESDELENLKRRAARQISQRVKIPGFRPGKAPYPVVLRQIGEGAILEQALESFIDEKYSQIIKDAGIKPYGPGSLENIVSKDPLILEFKVPLQGEVTLGDYRQIRKTYEPPIVTDVEIEGVLQDLQERQAIIEPVERPAQIGDYVTIQISGKRLNPQEGQDEIILSDRHVPIIIRPAEVDDERSKEEWPFPGFNQNLIGMSANDERKVTYRFPDDHPISSFRGAEVEYQFSIESVKSRTLPALDDDFAVSLGDFKDLEHLKTEIRKKLEEDAKSEYNEEYDREILDQAIGQSVFRYPPQMLEDELERVIRDLEKRLARQNITLDLYLKTRKMDLEALKEELKPIAESRIKQDLFLLELSEAENITVETKELEKETISTLDSLSRILPERDVRRLSTKDGLNALVGNIYLDLLSKRTLERFRDLCSGKLDQPAEETQTQGASETPENVTETSPKPSEVVLQEGN